MARLGEWEKGLEAVGGHVTAKQKGSQGGEGRERVPRAGDHGGGIGQVKSREKPHLYKVGGLVSRRR